MNCVIIIPLKSKKGSGMCRAGLSLLNAIPSDYNPIESSWNRIFQRLNDSKIPRVCKMLARLFLVQFTGIGKNCFYIYASHHAPVLKRRTNTAVIIHDLISLENPQQHSAQTFLFKTYVPMVLKKSQNIVAISNYTKSQICKFYDTSPSNISVIPSAVDTLTKWNRGGENWVARKKSNRLLFVGAQYEHKNLTLLVKAIHDSEINDIEVLIVNGNKSLWENLLNASEIKTLNKHFVFTNYLSDDALEHIYETSLALVYISNSEGFGIPPLEAYHKGCPVVCSNLEVLIETCGQAANFVNTTEPEELKKAIENLYFEFDEEKYRQCEQKGYAELVRFKQSELNRNWSSFLITAQNNLTE